MSEKRNVAGTVRRGTTTPMVFFGGFRRRVTLAILQDLVLDWLYYRPFSAVIRFSPSLKALHRSISSIGRCMR